LFSKFFIVSFSLSLLFHSIRRQQRHGICRRQKEGDEQRSRRDMMTGHKQICVFVMLSCAVQPRSERERERESPSLPFSLSLSPSPSLPPPPPSRSLSLTAPSSLSLARTHRHRLFYRSLRGRKIERKSEREKARERENERERER
jgi:hypothetical protein